MSPSLIGVTIFLALLLATTTALFIVLSLSWFPPKSNLRMVGIGSSCSLAFWRCRTFVIKPYVSSFETWEMMNALIEFISFRSRHTEWHVAKFLKLGRRPFHERNIYLLSSLQAEDLQNWERSGLDSVPTNFFDGLGYQEQRRGNRVPWTETPTSGHKARGLFSAFSARRRAASTNTGNRV